MSLSPKTPPYTTNSVSPISNTLESPEALTSKGTVRRKIDLNMSINYQALIKKSDSLSGPVKDLWEIRLKQHELDINPDSSAFRKQLTQEYNDFVNAFDKTFKDQDTFIKARMQSVFEKLTGWPLDKTIRVQEIKQWLKKLSIEIKDQDYDKKAKELFTTKNFEFVKSENSEHMRKICEYLLATDVSETGVDDILKEFAEDDVFKDDDYVISIFSYIGKQTQMLIANLILGISNDDKKIYLPDYREFTDQQWRF